MAMCAAPKRFNKHFPLIGLPNVDSRTGHVDETAFTKIGALTEEILVVLASIGADEFGADGKPGIQIAKKGRVAAVLVFCYCAGSSQVIKPEGNFEEVRLRRRNA